jgi:hypothetical protein
MSIASASLSTSQLEAVLASYGYVARHRDPSVNPQHQGAFMVCDEEDNKGYAIVGDDRDELIIEAHRHLGLPVRKF